MDKSNFQVEAESLLHKIDIIGNGEYHKAAWLATEFGNLVKKYITSSSLSELESVAEVQSEISRAKGSKKEEVCQRALSQMQSHLKRMIEENIF